MSVSFEEFMADLEPDLPLCPVPVIERRLREAAIEACEDAAVWRFDHPEICLLKDQLEYALQPPADSDVHSILAVSRDSIRLDPTVHISVNRRGYVSLPMRPARDSAVGKGLFLTVTLKPTRRGLSIGDEVYRDHYKMIVAGTLSKCYAMAAQPWADAELARQHRAVFEQEIAGARRARERGYVTGSHRLKNAAYAAPTRRGY